MGRGKSRPDGQYEVKVTVDHDFEGKPIRKSFYSPKSKADARRKAEEYKIEIAIKKQTGKMSVNDTFEQVVEKLYAEKSKVIRDSTQNVQLSAIRKNFYPELRKRKISSIKTTELKQIFADLAQDKAHSTLELFYAYVSSVFNFALDNDIIHKSPMFKRAYLSELGEETEEKRAYTADQISDVLNYCQDHPSQTSLAVHMMLQYGLSKSETLGLTHDVIEEKIFKVVQSLTMQNNIPTITKTKNKHRKRALPLFEATCELISKVEFEKDCKYLFSRKGKLMNVTTFTRHFDKFMKEMSDHYAEQGKDIPPLHCHELRHSRATFWGEKVKNEEGILAFIRSMGWSSTRMVDVYVKNDIEFVTKVLTEMEKKDT